MSTEGAPSQERADAGRPLRVLVAGERFHPEEFRVNDLVRDWVARGHQVRVLTQVPSYPHGEVFPGWTNEARHDERWEGASVRRVPTVTGYEASLGRKLLNYLSFALRGSWAAWTDPFKPDVVFCFNSGPLTSAIPAVVAARRWRVPLLIWTQDVWPDSIWAYGIRRTPLREYLLNGLVRWVYRDAARVLISCNGFRQALAPFLRSGLSVEHLPNWAEELDLDLPPRELASEDLFQFTFAGNLGRVQNLDRVLSAFAGLPAGLQDRSQLNLIGDGSHAAALRERVERERIPSVRFWGRVPSCEMAAFYRSSHVLLVTLEDDPLFKLTVPAKFQTCLAAGKPILAAVGGEVNRLVETNRLGLVADPGSVEDIRLAMERFIEMDAAEREEMCRCSGQLLDQSFRREQILGRMNQILSETLLDPT